MREQLGFKIKKTLWTIIIIVLLLPLIQAELGIPIVPKVEGWSEKIKKPKFSKQNWFNGNYQKTQDEYIKQNVGYKRFFVRFYNQFYYSFFNEAKANSVIIGKQNYLYETPYIDAYLGKSYVGKNAIRSKVEKLKKISASSNLRNRYHRHFSTWKSKFLSRIYPRALPKRKKNDQQL